MTKGNRKCKCGRSEIDMTFGDRICPICGRKLVATKDELLIGQIRQQVEKWPDFLQWKTY